MVSHSTLSTLHTQVVRPHWLQQCVVRGVHVDEAEGSWAVRVGDLMATKQEAGLGAVSGMRGPG